MGVEHAVDRVATASSTRATWPPRRPRAGALVAACGGDGFVGTVAGAVRNTDGALAVIPGGRGNDFARVLGIPTNPRERRAARGRAAASGCSTSRLCNGEPFVCIASFGFDSDANRIANETKVVKGNLVYLYAALKALWQWKPARFTVTVDGERHEFTGYTVAVGNSKAFGGGMYALPARRARRRRARRAARRRHAASCRYAAAAAARSSRARTARFDVVSFLRGKQVEVDADRPFEIYADGDPIADLPCTVDGRAALLAGRRTVRA